MTDKQKRIENQWKYLNSIGIHTMEELREAMKKQKPLNISVFVSPVPGKKEEAM
jgi:hypothetical protein